MRWAPDESVRLPIVFFSPIYRSEPHRPPFLRRRIRKLFRVSSRVEFPQTAANVALASPHEFQSWQLGRL